MKLTGTTLQIHDQIIKEPPLETFKQFVEYYNLAFSLIDKTDTLSVAWATNTNFRNTLITALENYGLPLALIEKLTNSELQELLLISDGGVGLIFRQNDAYPKLMSISAKMKIILLNRRLYQILSSLSTLLPLKSISQKLEKSGLSTKFLRFMPKKLT